MRTHFDFGYYIKIIIIMCFYPALTNVLRTREVHINLNAIFYTHVELSPTETIYTKQYMETHTHTHTHARTHARTHAHTHTHTPTLYTSRAQFYQNNLYKVLYGKINKQDSNT